jgi:hypothetical protein
VPRLGAEDAHLGPQPLQLAAFILGQVGCFRRLQVRWDRDSGRWFAFVLVACALTCCNRL